MGDGEHGEAIAGKFEVENDEAWDFGGFAVFQTPALQVQKGTSKCTFPPKKSTSGTSAQVRRNSKYYVVSVLGVLLGISSLVFTVWCIEVDENGRGFDDQGRKGREEETFSAGGWNSICIYTYIYIYV